MQPFLPLKNVENNDAVLHPLKHFLASSIFVTMFCGYYRSAIVSLNDHMQISIYYFQFPRE